MDMNVEKNHSWLLISSQMLVSVLFGEKTKPAELVLTGVELSRRTYCHYHLTGQIHNMCVVRSVSLRDITSLVDDFTFGLWNKFGKFSK